MAVFLWVNGRFMGESMGEFYREFPFSFNELGAMGDSGAINSHIQSIG